MHTGNLANDMLDLHPETPDISMRNERPKDQTMFLLFFFFNQEIQFCKDIIYRIDVLENQTA